MSSPNTPKLNPKKLLLSKWTAVAPQSKEKHFIVIKLLWPDDPAAPLRFIALEAVFSRRVQVLPWRELQDTGSWRQGWR